MARVALAIPCYMEALRPADGRHAWRVLDALGDDVTVIDGRCCGQPAFNSGFHEEARTAGRELLRAARDHSAVVVPSGSCTSMVSHYLAGLFEGRRREGAAAIAGRFVEFTSYVASHPGLEGLPLRLAGTVAYHDSCHARRELALTETVVALLGRVEGLEVRRFLHEDECCGFGGSFSIKLPEVSTVMMSGKLGDVESTGAGVLVSADLSCLLHLEAGARASGMRLETWSVAEVLSRALP